MVIDLTSETSGVWEVRCSDGSRHLVDLDRRRYVRCVTGCARGGARPEALRLMGVEVCVVGEPARLVLADGRFWHFRQTAQVRSILPHRGEGLGGLDVGQGAGGLEGREAWWHLDE